MRKLKVEKTEPKPKNSHISKSLYQKYQCQYKKKSILTKLSSDSGYPQDVLQLRGQSLSHSSNYVKQNKKNLKNFFKERIPFQNNMVETLMKKDNQFVHPRRIFEMKQMQFEMKYRNKFNLKNQLDFDSGPNVSATFDKFDANFHVNDKNKELKEKYGGQKDSFLHYQQDNYRRGTQSHIQKRSKVLKKQAYDKVFGPDVSSMSRTAGFDKKSYILEATPPRAKSISLTSPFKQGTNHKNLKALITKMHNYKNKLEQAQDSLNMQEHKAQHTDNEQNIVQLIQNMTRLYQKRSIQQGNPKIQSIEDISKMSKQFYEEMQNHKNHRLSKRKQLIFQTIPVAPCSDSSNTSSPIKGHSSNIRPDNYSEISGKDSEREENVENQKMVLDRSDFLNAVSYRFQLLKRSLVKWAALFYIYGINKEDIFAAFKLNAQPYTLQGSYAFFKFVKNGDIPSINAFLSNNRQFVFQVNNDGKTPLSYATYHNQTEVALLILNIGVNCDNKCFKGHTPLYYALAKRNVTLAKAFLQRGASPWSTDKNPYFTMIQQGQNKQELQILFNNSKKIYIGMQLQPSIQKRKQFWEKTHHKISQNQILSF